MNNDFFVGFRPPSPPPGLRARVLTAARSSNSRSAPWPLLGRFELAWLGAALVLIAAHGILFAVQTTGAAAGEVARAQVPLTGDPPLDVLVTAEARRWAQECRRNLLTEVEQ
ncbi:MAG: hypothetical protein HRF46_13070 [Acidobacteriota bacterium]|jgi:hypothetical protein